MATNTLKLGSQAPDFNLPAVDGNAYSLDSFSDKKGVVVIFSCNHCPYVKAYENRIMQIQEDYKNDIAVVAINSNDAENYPDDSFENMKVRAAEMNFNFVYLRDEDQSIAKAYHATHTPEIFLFDGERKLVYQGKIDDNWKEPENVKVPYLRNAINEMVAGKNVSEPETFSIGCTIKWKNN